VRYVGLALFAEGPSDHRLLGPLLRRLTLDLCRRKAYRPVETGEVLELHSPADLKGRPRDERILASALSAAEAWNVLFVHADGRNSSDEIRLRQVEPAIRQVRESEQLGESRAVAVVPVQETEAWALADGDALRRAFGVNAPDDRLGVPQTPREVEAITAPKAALDAGYRSLTRPGRRTRRKAVAFFELLGGIMSLDVLRQVPAFQRLESELEEALGSLRIIG